MFRIEAFVDDKKLADALRSLAGIVLGSPQVQPVANATAKGGTVTANGNGDAVVMFTQYAKDNKLAELSSAELKNFCTQSGWSRQSSGYFSKKLIDAGVLKKVGKGVRARYMVKK